jgi:hypothetical protein
MEETIGNEGAPLEVNTPEVKPEAPVKEPEAIIQKVGRHFRISNFIYIAGAVEMGIGAVLGIAIFFVNMAGFRGYGYNYYYNMPRFSSFFSSFLMGLVVFLAFLMSGAMTLGFGKLVQAAEIYIQRRSKK